MASDNHSAAESIAPLNPRSHRVGMEPREVEDLVEVSSKMTRSVPIQVGGSVTSRWRRLRAAVKSSLPRVVSDILEGEDKEVPCNSGSLNYSEFAFLADEEIPKVSSEEDKIDEVDRYKKFHDYLVLHRPQIILRLSRERVESSYAAKDVDSVVTEAELFIWQGLFWVP